MKRYLDTSDGMDAYAERHGAKFDPTCRMWYVTGEPSPALRGLLIDTETDTRSLRVSGLQKLDIDPTSTHASKRRQDATPTHRDYPPR